VVLFSASAEAKPTTLTLATDVLRFPPLAASGPVSETSSEIPNALARKATASPLNVVVACAKLATGLRAKIAVRQIAIAGFFFVIMCTFSSLPVEVSLADLHAAAGNGNRSGS
jgi:hypothetical protein